MRRRQRRLRSWWRHEQRSVAAALAAATHHSAPRSGWPEQHNAPRGPTIASAMEVEAHEQYYAPRGQEQPPPGVRPAPLPEVAGPQAAVTVGYVAARAPLVSDMLHDDATVQFLLQQSLLARSQEEEEEAREQEEDKRQEEAVLTRMLRLEAEVMKYAGRDRSQHSDLEKAAVTLVAHSDALRRRRERRRKRKKQRKKKLPRAPRPRCGRPCVHQRQVPAVRFPVVTQRQVPTVHLSCSLCSSWTRFLTCPLWYFDRCFSRWCRKLWLSRSCSPSTVVDIPFVPQRQNLMVQTIQRIIEIPQLLLVFLVVAVPAVLVVQILRCCRGEDRVSSCRQAQMLGILAGMAP